MSEGEYSMEENNTEIVKVDGEAVEKVLTKEQEIAQIEQDLERQFYKTEAATNVILRKLRPKHFERWPGSVRLNNKGALEIAKVLGISTKIISKKRNELEGGHYEWSYVIRATMGNRSNDVAGGCDSKDKFFGTNPKVQKKWDENAYNSYTKKNGMSVPTGKITESKPLAVVDESMILRKAYTNTYVNAISRLFNFHSIDPMEFEDITKIKLEQITFTAAKNAPDPDLQKVKDKQRQSQKPAATKKSEPVRLANGNEQAKAVQNSELFKHKLESMSWEELLDTFADQAEQFYARTGFNAYRRFLKRPINKREEFVKTKELNNQGISRRKTLISAYLTMRKEYKESK